MFSLFKKPAPPAVPAVPEAPALPAPANGKYDVLLERGMPVRVHFNLHKGLWVIAAKLDKGWRTVHNCDALTLTDCSARIEQGTLRRLKNEKRRKVCARIEGYLENINPAGAMALDTAGKFDDGLDGIQDAYRVAFNPYRADTFTCGGAVWERGACVYFAKKRPEDKAPAGARCYEVN